MPDNPTGEGPYVILQWVMGALTAAGAAVAGLYALFSKGSREEPHRPEEQRIFLDGPLVAALNKIERMAAGFEQLVNRIGDVDAVRKEITETRHGLRNEVLRTIQESEALEDRLTKKAEALEERVRLEERAGAVRESRLASLEDRVKAMESRRSH